MALPSLTELGLLQHNQDYAPWWTTLDVDFQEAYKAEETKNTAKEEERPRKRRAVSPDADADADAQDKPLPVAVPDTEDVPELEVDDSPESSPEPSEASPQSSPETSPVSSPQTSPETPAADLALPIRRLLPPHYLLPLPLPTKDLKNTKEAKEAKEETKRKRQCLAMSNLLSPAPHVYCLYKMDRVDQLGGKRRGMRWRR